MSHLSLPQLNERAKYLIENITTLTANGKIGCRDIKTDPGRGLMRLFTHVLQELANRDEFFTKGFMTNAAMPKPLIEKSEMLLEIKALAEKKKPHLLKFGKMCHLKEFCLQISLASSFNDPSLNLAQMDDELKAIFHPPLNEIKITDMAGNAIHGVESVKVSLKIDRDYYIFCSAHTFDYRLFGDFDADCCLFIYDSQRFSDEIVRELSNQVELKDYAYKPVEYLDPIKHWKNKQPQIEFHKHLKYGYQNVFRHVFIPRCGTNLSKKRYVYLPQLVKYCELITL